MIKVEDVMYGIWYYILDIFFVSLVSLMTRKFCFDIGELLFSEEKRRSNLSLKVP